MGEHLPYATYVLVDPLTGQIRYVGKTKQRVAERLGRHVRDAQEKRGERWSDITYRANWIRSLLFQGHRPTLEVVHRYATLEEVNEAERFLIRHIRPAKSNLTNTTDGGDGGIASRAPVVEDGEVIAAYVGGMSSTKISRKFKTCKKRVLNVLKKAGVALRPSGRTKGA